MTKITRRLFVTGVAGTAVLVAGCTGGRDGTNGGDGAMGGGSGSGESETHGGVTVGVEHHMLTTEILDRTDDGICIESIESGMTRLLVLVRVDSEAADSDVDPWKILETATLLCDGESHELRSIAAARSDDTSVDRFQVGFEVPEGRNPSSCELEVRWQGDGSSEESFRFGLGPEQELDIPENAQRCDIEELRESFAVRVKINGNERLLFGADDVDMVGPVEEANGSYRILITVSDDGMEKVEVRLRDTGVLDNPGEARILVELDGEVMMDLGMSPELAEQIEGSEWDGRLLLLFDDRTTVEEIREVLIAEG